MNEWLQNLKEGDTVVVSSRRGDSIEIVTRTTKTQMIVNGYRYRRTDGKQVGGPTWHSIYLQEATQERVEQTTGWQHRINMIAKLRGARWNNCKTETLDKVVELFDADQSDLAK